MAIAEIHVTLKPTLLDVQGATVLKALHQLGHTQVQNVRVGKHIIVEVDDAQAGADLPSQLDAMCRQLLSNPVIEDYTVTLADGNATTAPLTTTPVVATVTPETATPSLAGAAPAAVLTPTLPDPFAMDYDFYTALSAEEKLAAQGRAWENHGAWILGELSTRNAAWILCVGQNVLESGATIDNYPGEARLAELGTANGLVPWVFTKPPV
jgi:phosphoribosylformylglycinamidine synthase subunit PurS